MQGLEFVVSYDPLQAAAQSNNQFAHEPSNIWVIHKQVRRKRSGLDDEVEVLSTFFVVGDCIYMAPSVASVVGNRIVCLLTPSIPAPSLLQHDESWTDQRHFRTAFSRDLTLEFDKDGSLSTKLHPSSGSYLPTAKLQVHRRRPAQRATQQGEHADAGRRLDQGRPHGGTVHR